MLKDLMDLIKEQGPIQGAWICIFVFIAWLAGQGGKVALNTIKSLLEQSELLRSSLGEQLDLANERIECQQDLLSKSAKQLRDQQAELLDMQAQLSDLRSRLLQSHLLQQNLQSEMMLLRDENTRLRARA